jgi:hypothetical protein
LSALIDLSALFFYGGYFRLVLLLARIKGGLGRGGRSLPFRKALVDFRLLFATLALKFKPLTENKFRPRR